MAKLGSDRPAIGRSPIATTGTAWPSPFTTSSEPPGYETLHSFSRAAGTFDYMAPEEAVGYVQPSSDIYSLARVAIEMLTGRLLKDLLPGAGLDLPDRVRALMRSLTVNLSDESIELLADALEFDPARRTSDALAFSSPLVRDLESNGVERTF